MLAGWSQKLNFKSFYSGVVAHQGQFQAFQLICIGTEVMVFHHQIRVMVRGFFMNVFMFVVVLMAVIMVVVIMSPILKGGGRRERLMQFDLTQAAVGFCRQADLMSRLFNLLQQPLPGRLFFRGGRLVFKTDQIGQRGAERDRQAGGLKHQIQMGYTMLMNLACRGQ